MLTQLVRGILCALAVPVVLVCTGVFCLGSLTLLSLFSTYAVRCEPLVPTGKGVVKGQHLELCGACFLQQVMYWEARLTRCTGRMTAQMSGDFVVVLIGSAFSSWRSVPRAISTALSMRHMLKELQVCVIVTHEAVMHACVSCLRLVISSPSDGFHQMIRSS